MSIPALVLEWLAYRMGHYDSALGDPGICQADQDLARNKAETYREILDKLKELS